MLYSSSRRRYTPSRSSPTPTRSSPLSNSTQLVKAQLIPAQGEGSPQPVYQAGPFGPIRIGSTRGTSVQGIQFQFNPTDLSISRSVELNSNTEGRTSTGVKKISFAGPAPIEISISNIVFDTYESGVSVKTQYTNPLMAALDFTVYQASVNGYRPPIYTFVWGQTRYIERCFVKSLSLKYTLFLPDGTPVRATADIKLQQVERDGVTRPKQS